MSTPEQPATPALTRKQIRELRNTGSTPVITAAPPGVEPADTVAVPALAAPAVAPVAAAPFPRPAEPAAVAPAPVPDSAVDLGVSPLTRRQARQQEKIRTASVPVITPEVVAAHAAATSGAAPAAFAAPALVPPPSPFTEPERPMFTAPDAEGAAVSTDSGMHALFGIPREVESAEPAPVAWAPAAPIASAPTDSTPVETAPAADVTPGETEAPVAAAAPDESQDEDAIDDVFGTGAFDAQAKAEASAKSVVNPLLGAGLLDEAAPVSAASAAEIPASFDQLLSRSTGAVSVPNTLIVAQAPEVSPLGSPLVAPVTSTGEIIVTGTFNLPEGLGSTGHAKGTADGKEIDATLVDGELPSHSSPTPIAASAAVSTAKLPGEVIKPPAPEKGSKLMMSLAITAGVLALALVGVLILAFATGVF